MKTRMNENSQIDDCHQAGYCALGESNNFLRNTCCAVNFPIGDYR